jgi:hypothetical protein
MRVVLRTSLKGSQVWIAGTVFDSSEAPIPSEVMYEVRAGSSIVEVLSQGLAPPDVVAPPVPQIEIHMTPETFPEPEIPPPLEVEKEAYHYGSKQKESPSKESPSKESPGKEIPGKEESEKVARRSIRK